MASPAEGADHLEHPQRAAIPIGDGQSVIDHQNLSSTVRLPSMSVDKPDRASEAGDDAQPSTPALSKLRLIHLLIGLDT